MWRQQGGYSHRNATKKSIYHASPSRPAPAQYGAQNYNNNNNNGAYRNNYNAPNQYTCSYRNGPSSLTMASGPGTPTSYPQQDRNSYSQQTYQHQAQAPGGAYSAAPVIQNPFPLPGQDNGSNRQPYDPELEAQIAQWQSAYVAREDSSRNVVKREEPQASTETSTSTHDAKSKATDAREMTVVRKGAGKKWEDASLLEWGDDPRLFVGNLAGEVTDESLLKAFSKFNAAKARVVRDKRTTKSKGYGFVSFPNADDFFRAAKEMVGKYIGSHPVTIKKAEKIARPSAVKGHDLNRNNKNRNRKGDHRDGHANTGAGVQKPQKTKGPKLLG